LRRQELLGPASSISFCTISLLFFLAKAWMMMKVLMCASAVPTCANQEIESQNT